MMSLAQPFSVGSPFKALSKGAPRRARPPQQATAAIFSLGQSSDKRTKAKTELLEVISRLNRGSSASASDKEEVEQLAQQLERINPIKKVLASPLLSAKWELKYTTSASILGTNKPPFLRPQGPIYQTIDAAKLTAKNQETWPFFNQVKAELTPETSSRVAVQFKEFRILGLIPIQAPPSARGKLDTTYLDEDLRISRGDKGNLFVLERAGPVE
ncbi:probable plastid-lipid-associated protein 4, chloroplastic [Coccomyxa sp. Obi]|nr:probable plastid-lipid-associated protein 4, chloroplastic [Coccomyxa sp. Obi]